jgi:hypothetical protein
MFMGRMGSLGVAKANPFLSDPPGLDAVMQFGQNAGPAVPQALFPQPDGSIAAHPSATNLSGDRKLHLDRQILKRCSSSSWRISFGWIGVLQQ